MKVFISWSGKKSGAVAEAVAEWLGFVHQSVETWVSSKDIHAGDRWATEIEKGLHDASYGIICVTPDNVDSKWINYEAGAISKKIGTSSGKVAVLLIDFDSEADLEMPLSQFHAVMMTREGFDNLATSINAAIEDTHRPDSAVLVAANMAWPMLKESLESIEDSAPPVTKHKRSEQDLLQEIVLRLRDMDGRMDHMMNRGFHLASGDSFEVGTSVSSTLSTKSASREKRRDFARFIRSILDTEGRDWGILEAPDGGIEVVLEQPLHPGDEALIKKFAYAFLDTTSVTITVDRARAIHPSVSQTGDNFASRS